MICFYLTTFLIGFLITKSFIKENVDKFLIFSFSVVFGITIETFFIFILMMLNINNYSMFVVAEILILLIAILISKIKKVEYFPKNKDKSENKNKFLNVMFIITLLIAIIQVFYMIKICPYGTWDAHYLWNLRPKSFIALKDFGVSWKMFFNPVIYWTHLDYPLLFPIYNYKNHILYGSYNPVLNMGTSIFVLCAIVSGVYGLVQEISSKQNALLSVITLLTTEMFIFWAMSQCADVPLSLFILTSVASISLFVKYKNQVFIFFAYYIAASATFCKNEGIMFFLIFTVISLLLIKNQSKKMIVFGIILPIICLIIHKTFIWSTCDLFENQTFNIFLNRLLILERYKTIISVVVIDFMANFATLVLIFGAVCFSGFTENLKLKTLSKVYISIIILAILGYFTIYLITPMKLEWHIKTTDTRLIIQYLPLFLVFCFTAFNCANEKNTLPNIENKNN